MVYQLQRREYLKQGKNSTWSTKLEMKQRHGLKSLAEANNPTVLKMKFSIKDFFSKCDQIHSFLRIWSHLLKKSLVENFIFCAVSRHWSAYDI